MSASPESPAHPKTASPTTATTTNSNGAPPRSEGGGGALERVLPHSLDAERALLGSMLLEEAAIGEAITVLADAASRAFWSEKHQRLYDHVVELWKERGPVDAIVIKDTLDRKRMFEELGGYEFLAGLVAAVPSAQRVRHYAQIVRNKLLLRQLVDATHRVMNAAFDESDPPERILDEAERLIFAVTERRVTSSADTLLEQINALFQRIQDRTPHVGEQTGFLRLDDLTSGLHKSELIIVAGRPSMGKTALGLNIAENMALRHEDPVPVLFFSLEMSRAALAERVLTGRARVDAQRLRKARTTPQDVEALQRAADEIVGRPLLIDDTPGLTIMELRARARIAWRKHGIRAVFVDYLQLMHAPGKESRQIEVAEISRGLKALAKDLDVPVIAMAQLNRNPEERTGNRPRMSDLRESGAIEQDADVVMLLHREAYYRDKARAAEADGQAGYAAAPDPDENKAEVIIAKQRNGPTGTVELYFDRRTTRFADWDDRAPQHYANTPEAVYGSNAPF